MALNFAKEIVVTKEAMEDCAAIAIGDLVRQLVRVSRPDWETVRIKVAKNDDPMIPNSFRIRLLAEGGTRNCIVRGG